MPKTSLVRQVRKGNSPEEVELLAALLRGKKTDAATWQAFVRRYERLIASCVVRALRRFGASFTREDVDDLVGDVWVALLKDDRKKLRQYDAERGFRLASFIGLVATNLTIDHLRARQCETSSLDELSEDSGFLVAEDERDEVEERQDAALAQIAFSKLSLEERTFLVDCYQSERSPRLLAGELGVSLNTVYSRKFKLREKLGRIVRTIEGGALASA